MHPVRKKRDLGFSVWSPTNKGNQADGYDGFDGLVRKLCKRGYFNFQYTIFSTKPVRLCNPSACVSSVSSVRIVVIMRIGGETKTNLDLEIACSLLIGWLSAGDGNKLTGLAG